MTQTRPDADTLAVVVDHLGARAPQGELRIHRTDTPGHLDFSTPTTRGSILKTDTAPSRAEIDALLRRHSTDNRTDKAVILLTATAPACGRWSFPLHPIFHITSDGVVVPWNRCARTSTPESPYRVARRRLLTRTALLVVAATAVVIAVLTVLETTSDPIRTFALAVVVWAGLIMVTLVGTIANILSWMDQTPRLPVCRSPGVSAMRRPRIGR